MRSGGVQNFDSAEVKRRLVTTLNAGLGQCRSGLGDTVFVLPDHAENVSSADQMSNLVAGTRIVGLGQGNLRPTFTWSVAGATFLFDVANVSLENCVLNMAGSRTSTTALTVAAPITVSAAGCTIRGCEINFGIDADQLTTIGVTTTAGGDDLTFANNFCFAATTAPCTTFLRLVGADRAKILGNTIIGATSAAAVGMIQFITTASTDVIMVNNRVRNNKSDSTAAVTGLAACTGYVDDLYMTVLGDHTDFEALGNANGAFSASVGSFTFGPNVYAANLAGEVMLICTPASS